MNLRGDWWACADCAYDVERGRWLSVLCRLVVNVPMTTEIYLDTKSYLLSVTWPEFVNHRLGPAVAR